MAKKQSKTSNNIDWKGFYNKVAQEKEAIIKFGKEHDFQIEFFNGMFIVKDKRSFNEPIAFTTCNSTEPKDYTSYVRNYIMKVRKLT